MDADNLKDDLESQPSMRMACKQLAEFGDNFKDCLHKPTLHEDGLHAPMEADTLKDGLHEPTCHEDGLQAMAGYGDNFKYCLHMPTCHEALACTNGSRQSQG